MIFGLDDGHEVAVCDPRRFGTGERTLGRSARRRYAGSPRPGCPMPSPAPTLVSHGDIRGPPGSAARVGPSAAGPRPTCQRSRVRVRRSDAAGKGGRQATRSARPAHDSRGALTCRWRTATRCRRMRISASLDPGRTGRAGRASRTRASTASERAQHRQVGESQ